MKRHSQNPKNIFYLLRVAKNLSANEVADMVGVARSYIHAIESDEKKPSSQLIKKYAAVLEVDEEVILTYHEDEKNTKFENVLLRLLQVICKEPDIESDNLS